jgi:type VI secretion system protein ImpJ
MKNLSRIVWSEGMYLAPHHFQAQSRYFEDSIDFTASALWLEPWGFSACRFHEEALLNGSLVLLDARGILPDGLPFAMPDGDALPPPRRIADLFPPSRDKVTVLLCLPERKPDGRNCLESPGEAGDARYVAEPRPTTDESTGRDEKPVLFGRKRFRLLLETEPCEGMLAMPAARIMRDGSGRTVFDPDFIPPCLTIAASERLMRLLARLIDLLDEKSVALAAGGAAAGRTWTEYSTRDTAPFWMLPTVNSAIAPLRELHAARHAHPERLFLHLLRLAGALCTFSLESSPRDLPAYDHASLEAGFSALERHIRNHLEIIVPTAAIAIPLRRTSECFWEGSVADQRCLDRARWILEVRAAAGEVEVISRTPQLVKVCSRLYVAKLVERALPGMALTHLPSPPPALAARVDAHYFSISRAGPCWDHIVETREVGVYVPGDLPGAELELLVLLQT